MTTSAVQGRRPRIAHPFTLASLAAVLIFVPIAHETRWFGMMDSSQANLNALVTDLFSQRSGFGADITGGAAGPVVHVTTDADSLENPQTGSLRAAVSRTGSAWIVFDGDFTIRLAGALPVTSNKTIDGRGRQVVITGHGVPGLLLDSVSNVIVENLTFTDFGDVSRTATNDTPDAIRVNASSGVWIDHNSLSVAGDKLIAIQGGVTATTVSWNHFFDQEQTFQIGSQATAASDTTTQVTLHHNYFDHTGYRNPSISYGFGHSYNNYLLNWRQYGLRSQRGGQLFSDNDMFSSMTEKPASRFAPAGDGCNDKETLCDDSPGFIRIHQAAVLQGPGPIQNRPELVASPPYSYQVEPGSEATAAAIAIGAGSR